MNNKKNIKIKHSKGRLYKKKRSPVKTAIETILLILVAGGLIFIGYKAAGPVIDYISGGGDTTPITGWTPSESILSTTPSTSASPTEASTEAAVKKLGSYLLSEAALQSKESLNGALTTAKNLGFNIIVVPLKDDTGNVLYKSDIDSLKNMQFNKGTLTAKEIADAVKAKGLVPKAQISALKDYQAPEYISGLSYFTVGGYRWYDAMPEDGGRQWIDPHQEGAKKYCSDIVTELKSAGFEEIVMSNTRYPPFQYGDIKYLDPLYFDENRYTELVAVYDRCFDASGKAVAVGVDIKDVIDGKGQDFVGTAELLKDKSFSGKIFLTVNLSDFGETIETADGKQWTLPKDAAEKAELLISKASEYISTNVTIVPVISSAGISSQDLVKCYEKILAE